MEFNKCMDIISPILSEQFTSKDTTNLIIYFLNIKSIWILATVSKDLNQIVKNHPIYDALIKFSKSGDKNISDWACVNNYIKILHWWNDYRTIEKFTINGIILAATFGHLNIVKFLISVGENIHTNDDYPLRYSANNGYLDVVKYLISVGVNIHADDDCALQWSAENGPRDAEARLGASGEDLATLKRGSEPLARTFRSCKIFD